MAPSTFTLLCSHRCHPFPERTLSIFRTETPSPRNTNSPSPSPNRPPFCLCEFEDRGYLREWNHPVFVRLWLLHFTRCNVLQVCPCLAGVRMSFLLITEQHSLCGGATPCLFMHLPMDLWVRLYFLGVTNRAAMNAGVQVLFFFIPAFNYFDYIRRSGIPELHSNSAFSFSRKHQTVFPRWLDHFASPLAMRKDSSFSTSSPTLTVFPMTIFSF